MKEKSKWFLERLQDKSPNLPFGESIKSVIECDDSLLIETFSKGLLSLLDLHVELDFGYYEYCGNGWNDNFCRTKKNFNLSLDQCINIYKFMIFRVYKRFSLSDSHWSLSELDSLIILFYIENNISLYWMPNQSYSILKLEFIKYIQSRSSNEN